MKLQLTRNAKKELAKLPKDIQDRVGNAFHYIAKHPFEAKKLGGELAGYYSHKMWPYRVIYTIDTKAKMITVHSVGHRQGVYNH